VKIFTAKEDNNGLGQVIDSALSAPALVGEVEITNDEQFNLLAGVSNGEVDISSAVSALHLKNKKELDDLSALFGIGLADKMTRAKQKRREAFFLEVETGKAKASDAFAFFDIAKECTVRFATDG
jgi:hypothetical protein